MNPMLALHGLPLVLQAAVPLALIAWQLLSRHRSVVQWLIKTSLVAGYLIAFHRAGLWIVLPWYTALVFLAVDAGVALWQVRRVLALPWRAAQRSWVSIVGRATLALITIVVLVLAEAGRQPPTDTMVDLRFPLADGVYYVAAGGSRTLINSHLVTLTAERFGAFRGQSYGVDLLKLGPLGLRAAGLLPRDNKQYAIYGDRVFAPCSGVVVRAEDGAPDMLPPEPDRSRKPGNHVLLDCAGVHVLLAHFSPGSVRVQAGEHVSTDTVVGLAGNSGNSNEPHLHIHAQRPAASADAPFSGDPLPIRFDGQYLVRNDRVAARRPATR